MSEGKLIAAPLSHGSNPNSNAAGRRREDDVNLVAGPLGGGNDGIGRRSEDDPNLVAQGVAFRGREGGIAAELSDIAPSMRSGKGSASRGSHALLASGVRRLTPRECERLQALPDNWTAHGADSRRYAALGDAVTASVAEWIGRRLLAASKSS